MRYVVIAFTILCCVCVYLNKRVDILKKENERLEDEKNALILNNERIVKNEVEVRKQNESLRKQISEDKSGFDWYYDLSNNPVRVRVSNECLSCSKD